MTANEAPEITPEQRQELLATSINVREAKVSDLPYILQSWRLAAHEHLTAPRGVWIPWRLFNIMFRHFQAQIIRRSKVIVAANRDDDTQIFGFSIVETVAPNDVQITKLIHWVQVKQTFWCHGIATMLLTQQNITPNDPTVAHSFAWPARPCIHSWKGWKRPIWNYAPFFLPFTDLQEENP